MNFWNDPLGQLVNACTGRREMLEIRSINGYSTGNGVINDSVEQTDGFAGWQRIEAKQEYACKISERAIALFSWKRDRL
ncbi:hypothetical protein [Thermoleptolyngbya sp. C42_A2020_037]|uniref:hypothetical protein n=1 Tax=Thermoleptolyngbya sp. C42_A2020_037 TaxID=2747799 RepID=UPI0019FB7C0A|nr:hypothetical protein [Thermoleptolyngbya sp. C42_A2020_037]MBF2085960.1 hypothetical protein [Thermoleptolyngbya sp. C42_A2020_037]